MRLIKVTVKPKRDRLDQFVADQVKNLSRSFAKKLIEQGNILVNDGQVDPSYKIRKNDKIKIESPATVQVSLKPEKIPLKIIYEDNDLLVIDKDAGIVVHPTLDHPTGTIVNAVLHYLKDFSKDDLRPGIVHRLDKNTSGLLVIGKTIVSTENLKQQFRGREVKKTYTALVERQFTKEFGTIDQPIARHPKFKTKFIVDKTGKKATTEFRILEKFSKYTLLQLKPLTGRTHQLRVHLSFIGHPIVGDKLYGGKMDLNRQFLHASVLTIKQPTTGETLEFHSNLPEDLKQFLDKLV